MSNGYFYPKISVFEGLFPNFGDKKPESRFISLQLGLSDLRLLRAQFYLYRVGCQRFTYFLSTVPAVKNDNKLS